MIELDGFCSRHSWCCAQKIAQCPFPLVLRKLKSQHMAPFTASPFFFFFSGYFSSTLICVASSVMLHNACCLHMYIFYSASFLNLLSYNSLSLCLFCNPGAVLDLHFLFPVTTSPPFSPPSHLHMTLLASC